MVEIGLRPQRGGRENVEIRPHMVFQSPETENVNGDISLDLEEPP